MEKRIRRPNATSDEQRAQYRKETRARFLERNLERRRAQYREYNKRRYWADPGAAIKRAVDWANNHPEVTKARIKRWKQNNKVKLCDDAKYRYRCVKEATPKWLSYEQLQYFEFMKAKAKAMTARTGIRHVVDHVIPLRGKNVRGLHVPWNLQILTNSENSRKSNKVG